MMEDFLWLLDDESLIPRMSSNSTDWSLVLAFQNTKIKWLVFFSGSIDEFLKSSPARIFWSESSFTPNSILLASRNARFLFSVLLADQRQQSLFGHNQRFHQLFDRARQINHGRLRISDSRCCIGIQIKNIKILSSSTNKKISRYIICYFRVIIGPFFR